MVSASSSKAAYTGRVAVVTGSNQGIGYHIALQLAQSGKFNDVVLACRSESKGLEALEKMKKDVDISLQYENLIIGDHDSHVEFAKKMEERFGKVDVLVNNAAIAFKGSDPTPFEGQCKPTLDVNFRGTVDFTEQMLPLTRKGSDPRIINLSSSASRLSQVSPALQEQFSSPDLTMENLRALVDKFQSDVQNGNHQQNGWSNSNYGISKLAITAATKIWARDEPNISVNCCDPGYCATFMSSYRGPRPPEEGAKNAVIPATMENPPTGELFRDFKVSTW